MTLRGPLLARALRSRQRREMHLSRGMSQHRGNAARTLARRRDLADLFVGVTGDFVPAREVLRPSFVVQLLLGSRAR